MTGLDPPQLAIVLKELGTLPPRPTEEEKDNTRLDLACNKDISFISPLDCVSTCVKAITNIDLTYLNLDDNHISDIQPLAGLLNLNGLSLFNNQVADIQPLVANAENGGLGPGDYVILDAATMSDRALTIDIPLLQQLL